MLVYTIMTKITHTKDLLTVAEGTYCRIVLTEEKVGANRLVEMSEGRLEYRLSIAKRVTATPRTFRTLVRSIVWAAKQHKLKHIALEFDISEWPTLEAMGEEWFFRTLGENLELAQYEFLVYKTGKRAVKKLREILVCGVDTPAKKRSFLAGLTIGRSANLARDIANTPGDDMKPSQLASAAKVALQDTTATVRVFDKKSIATEKMGLLEAVGKGAADGPYLIVIEYWGAGKPTKSKRATSPIALIGKGITYDSGGLNMKPVGAMHDMHLDMAGGAALIGAMQAIGMLGIRKNVVAVIPAAENSVSATSMRAGDIATSMLGKTVEIVHTDAEGRLVLADAMTYAERHYAPRVMLDVATLTGASLVALGQQTSALLTKDMVLSDQLVALGEETGDLVWPLPLWDEYRSMLKSDRADLTNIAANFTKWAGCIEGGVFLSHFAPKKIPWAHIDIASRMESISGDKLAKGATGEPVRLLVRFVEEY